MIFENEKSQNFKKTRKIVAFLQQKEKQWRNSKCQINLVK